MYTFLTLLGLSGLIAMIIELQNLNSLIFIASIYISFSILFLIAIKYNIKINGNYLFSISIMLMILFISVFIKTNYLEKDLLSIIEIFSIVVFIYTALFGVQKIEKSETGFNNKRNLYLYYITLLFTGVVVLTYDFLVLDNFSHTKEVLTALGIAVAILSIFLKKLIEEAFINRILFYLSFDNIENKIFIIDGEKHKYKKIKGSTIYLKNLKEEDKEKVMSFEEFLKEKEVRNN